MDHLHLYVAPHTLPSVTNFDSSNSEIDEEYPLMASVEAQMRGVTMSASNSRFLNLPGGAYVLPTTQNLANSVSQNYAIRYTASASIQTPSHYVSVTMTRSNR